MAFSRPLRPTRSRGQPKRFLQASEELPEGLALVGLQEGARPRTDEVEVEGCLRPAMNMAALPGGEILGAGGAQRRVLESRRSALPELAGPPERASTAGGALTRRAAFLRFVTPK